MLPLDRQPQSLCILRLSALGDATHTLPVVRAIQQHWPGTRISWIIGKLERRLLAGVDQVDFIVFDKRGGWPEVRRLRAALRGRRFDVLLHLQVAARANLLMTPKAPRGCAGVADPGEVGDVQHGPSLLTEGDIYLFKEGSHFKLYDKLGAHPLTVDGRGGTHFAVWAPNAERVSVIGDFNGWKPKRHRLEARWDGSGIWEGFIPGLAKGCLYKYAITSKADGSKSEKADPLGLFSEAPPRSASVVWDLDYRWCDADWMARRKTTNSLDGPVSIYEVHIGSWRRVPEEGNRPLTYREMAPLLADYVKEWALSTWGVLAAFARRAPC